MIQPQPETHTSIPVLAHAVIAALIRAAGLRVTQPRIIILMFMHQHPEWHISVEELYTQLADKREHVTLATCYRVVHEFTQANLINRCVLNAGRSVYEIARKTGHYHMVQEHDGKILEFQVPHLDKLLEEIARHHGFELLERQLVLYVRRSSDSVGSA